MSQATKPRKHYMALTARAQRVSAVVKRHRALYAVLSAGSLLAITLGTRALTKVVGFSRLRKIIVFASLGQRLIAHPTAKHQKPND